jgi:hypothetical protein
MFWLDCDVRPRRLQTRSQTCAHWLAWRLGIEIHTARERVRVARALGGLPKLHHALAAGELTYAKVRALTRVATPETEERLLAFGKAGTAAHVERLVRGWRHVDRAAERQAMAAGQRRRTLQVYQDADGMVVVRGRAVLIQALNAARERLWAKARVNDPEGDPPLHSQQQADALGIIAEAALKHDLDPGPSGDRYQVVVHVDEPVLADPDAPGQSVLADGQHVPAGTCRRHRDQGCRFPGCGLPFTQGHHIEHWADGGPTTLTNLTLLCRRHHRSVHEDGFQVQRLPDGELDFRRPDGRPLHQAPPLPVVDDDIVEAWARSTRRPGCSWTGAPPGDVGWHALQRRLRDRGVASARPPTQCENHGGPQPVVGLVLSGSSYSDP